MMLKKIEFKKITTFFKKLPKVLAERPLFTLFALILLSLLSTALVFYQFYLLAQKGLVPSEERPLQFKEELCQEFLKILDERQKRFGETGAKTYPDLFRPQTPFETPELTE